MYVVSVNIVMFKKIKELNLLVSMLDFVEGVWMVLEVNCERDDVMVV